MLNMTSTPSSLFVIAMTHVTEMSHVGYKYHVQETTINLVDS